MTQHIQEEAVTFRRFRKADAAHPEGWDFAGRIAARSVLHQQPYLFLPSPTRETYSLLGSITPTSTFSPTHITYTQPRIGNTGKNIRKERRTINNLSQCHHKNAPPLPTHPTQKQVSLPCSPPSGLSTQTSQRTPHHHQVSRGSQ